LNGLTIPDFSQGQRDQGFGCEAVAQSGSLCANLRRLEKRVTIHYKSFTEMRRKASGFRHGDTRRFAQQRK